ncbi:MAG: YceI family protein [Rhodocyclaceae bacterium]|nr:YceI family protein [Pseudomonadota bacterium]MDP1654221.1 YceI family protein [Rhodocyclaceae bacterium]MDP1905589.1 YceI family protein [Pseudomonadota bacterium]
MKIWAVVLMCLALPALAQDWKLDPAKSQVRFVIKQMNVPTEGGFRRLVAHANFDPAKPESGRFRVDVDTASIDTGSAEGDDEVKRPAWFDTKNHPWASFIAKSVRRDAEGRYTAFGDLAIKGQSRPLAAPFTLTRHGAGWLAQGRFVLKRGSYGIGGGDWADVVADDLEVRFNLVLLP